MVNWEFMKRSAEFAKAWFNETSDGLGELYNGPLSLIFSENVVIEIMPYLTMAYLFLESLIALG